MVLRICLKTPLSSSIHSSKNPLHVTSSVFPHFTLWISNLSTFTVLILNISWSFTRLRTSFSIISRQSTPPIFSSLQTKNPTDGTILRRQAILSNPSSIFPLHNVSSYFKPSFTCLKISSRARSKSDAFGNWTDSRITQVDKNKTTIAKVSLFYFHIFKLKLNETLEN